MSLYMWVALCCPSGIAACECIVVFVARRLCLYIATCAWLPRVHIYLCIAVVFSNSAVFDERHSPKGKAAAMQGDEASVEAISEMLVTLR